MNNNLSVIIPTFNRKRAIYYFINSILKQTLKVNETIIIDDGSIDTTEKIVKKLMQNNSNIKYYKQSKNVFCPSCKSIDRERNIRKYLKLFDNIKYLSTDAYRKDVDKNIDKNIDITQIPEKDFSLKWIKSSKIRKILTKMLLIPFWYVAQKIAPWLDSNHRGWSLESAGFFVITKK